MPFWAFSDGRHRRSTTAGNTNNNDNINNIATKESPFCVEVVTVVSEVSCSWSSRALVPKVLVSLTAGYTDAWLASAAPGRHATDVTGDGCVVKDTESVFLFCWGGASDGGERRGEPGTVLTLASCLTSPDQQAVYIPISWQPHVRNSLTHYTTIS